MNTDNLFEQMANISKANAYDIVSKQAQELKEENEKLKKALQTAYDCMKSGDTYATQAEWEEIGQFVKTHPNVDLGKSFEKLKEDMREDNDDLKDVNI